MLLYAMKDQKTGQFGAPMVGVNDGHVSRGIAEALRGQAATAAQYPEDFDLFQVGDMHEETGTIHSDVRFVCNLSVILRAPAKEG